MEPAQLMESEDSSSEEELEFFDDYEDEFILKEYEYDKDEDGDAIVPQKVVRKYSKKKIRVKQKKIRHKYETFYTLRCEPCNKVFKHSTSYRKHMRRIHWNIKKHMCEICGKETFDWSDTVEHRKSHFTIKTNSCRECFKTFPDRETLKQHKIAEHEFFVCEICGRGFTRNNLLMKHKTTHSEETPFECEFCQKKFRDKRLLSNHVNGNHLGIRKTCFYCLDTFINNKNRNSHINRHHANEDRSVARAPHLYPHICKDCGKRFMEQNHLENHYCQPKKKIVHECSICGETFPFKKHLEEHNEEKHGIKRRKYTKNRSSTVTQNSGFDETNNINQ